MPTHQDETLQQRYARENHAYLKLCGSMTAEQVADLQLQLNNALTREQALQQRLTAADERIDELTARQGEPVEWGAPKTVRQLIRQLETLDQNLRPLSMLRVPGSVFEDEKERTRAVHLSFSHERVDGQWLAPFKSEGEKVLAFWCRMEQPAPVAVVPEGWQMVPVAPTDDMIVAFAEAWYSKHQTIDDPDMLDAYRDMLVAAPQHPQNL